MGGVAVDLDGRTAVSGLFAAGECACVSVHGANRLGGNSLLEAAVYGRIVGGTASLAVLEGATTAVGAKAAEEEERIAGLLGRRDGESIVGLRRELQRNLDERLGIFRSGESMVEGIKCVTHLMERFESVGVGDHGRAYNQALVAYMELGSMLLVAEAVARAALARRESRGSHYRTDHPERDDAGFLHHSLVRAEGGRMVLGTSPVQLGGYEVRERVY
jgi:succinate dehydrogenase flavoprotein subunit